jgi:hypothetical protein
MLVYPRHGNVHARTQNDKNFLFRPELGTGSESVCIPILTSSTKLFRFAGDVKRGGGGR